MYNKRDRHEETKGHGQRGEHDDPEGGGTGDDLESVETRERVREIDLFPGYFSMLYERSRQSSRVTRNATTAVVGVAADALATTAVISTRV